MVKMVIQAVVAIAVLVTLAALADAAIKYWYVTVLLIGAIVGGFYFINKQKDERNKV